MNMSVAPPNVLLRNNYKIPKKLALAVAWRDRVCVYCGSAFSSIGPSGNRRSSWEHIINDQSLVTPENIALCCTGCNGSKGDMSLEDWLRTDYCAKNSVSELTLAPVALAALRLQQGAISANGVKELSRPHTDRDLPR